jgi:beta-N-acetylhexosaminidase
MKKVLYGIIAVATVTVFGLLMLQQQKQPVSPAKNTQNHSETETLSLALQNALEAMTLRDKVASLFILHAAGTDISNLQSFVATYKPGGIILMGDNIPARDEDLKPVTAAIRGLEAFPRLVAIDEEGGIVHRLRNDSFASAETLRNLPAQKAKEAFSARSDYLRSLGITLNFGTIADVTDNPESFIYPRVLGTQPNSAADRVSAATDGSDGKVLSTLKHFPGHGRVSEDSHVSIPRTDVSADEWKRTDAVPFKSGIAAGADMVMLGHLEYSAVDTAPASLSKKWHDLLRSDLGFKGTSVTDDMFMLQNSGDERYNDPVRNAVSALKAGNDALLYVTNNNGAPETMVNPDTIIDGVVVAVQSGEVPEDSITKKAERMLTLRERAASFSR